MDLSAPLPPGTVNESAPSEAGSPARTGWLAWIDLRIPNDRAANAFIAILGAALFLPFLGALGFWDPWETHYGEVARAMIQRDDFVYPYWESSYFFSKPALPLWMMAFGFLITGAESGPPEAPLGAWAEFGARLPFVVVATLALWAVYRLGSLIRGRATGLIAAVVLASCPQFIFIGKQTMVDMPYVGFLTLGIALYALAVFDTEDDAPASSQLKLIGSLGFALAVFPQLFLIGRELTFPGLGGVIGAAVLAAGIAVFVNLRASRRDVYLLGFYTCLGLSALSKGLAPLAVIGPVGVLYILFSGDWRVIFRSKVLQGLLVFLLVGAPWYLTLSLFGGRDDEGLTFRERFWMHDNFGRVGAGVHGDRGGVGYFFEQLAYAMFPWAALVPFSVGHAAGQIQLRPPSDKTQPSPDEQRRRALLFVLIWGVWSYVFFTISLTKFHHYIFPAVPAFAVLAALWVTWLWEKPQERLGRGVAFVILALFAVIARDLINEPQNLVNLFTYKYDRDFPRDIVVRPYLSVIVGVGGAAMLITFLIQRKAETILAFVLSGVVFGAWVSHHHFNMLSPHWSQAHLFKTYFDQSKVTSGEQGRQREPIYAYQLNWRGETLYSRNRILQVKEKGANERMRELVDKPGREFIIVEQSRFQTLKGVLSPDKRDKLEIIDRSNNKFYLCVVQE